MLFTDFTWQDWVAAGMVEAAPGNKGKVIKSVVDAYKSSKAFQSALEANLYFQGNSPVIDKKTLLRGKVISYETEDGLKRSHIENEEIIGNRISSNFLFHFVTQENQYLLGNGVILDTPETKAKLGAGFDKALEKMGEKALLHGVCWAFWNKDHVEPIIAAKDAYSGFVALLDEMTGAPMVGVQFWQIADSKPLCVRLFEMDGITEYREDGNGELIIPEGGDKRAYLSSIFRDGAGEMEISGRNYDALPIVPLYANDDTTSEMTQSIKSKIDLYDRILSDFGDNLDRANDVYWVLNNFSGSVSDISIMMDYIAKLKTVINQGDGMGGGATAEPRTLEVPYQARQTALEMLKNALYDDYMALNMDEIQGGSLTNVAIQAATTNLNLKVDRFEWQCFDFVQRILRLIGVETEKISFVRQTLLNKSETVADIYTMQGDLDRETRLKLNPYILQEDIPVIMSKVDAEQTANLPNMDELQKLIDEPGEGE